MYNLNTFCLYGNRQSESGGHISPGACRVLSGGRPLLGPVTQESVLPFPQQAGQPVMQAQH